MAPSTTRAAFRAAYLTQHPRATAYDQIFLAENEWDNLIMRQVAAEWFAAHPDCNFVSVYEHAGWSLLFHRQDLECVGSANDAAVFRADRPRPTHCDLIHRRAVRRPDLRAVYDLAQYAP